MIDIIIITYKSYNLAKNIIKNILDITINKDYRILLIDNSHNLKEFNNLKEKIINDKVIYIENKSDNTSFSAGVNIGLKQSENDVIILNDDLIFNDGLWLDKLIEKINSDEKIGIVQLGEETRVQNKQLRQPDNLTYPLGFNLTNWRVSFMAVYITRNCINNIGFLDEINFNPVWFEDDDYCLRAKLNGYKLDVVWTDFIHLLGQTVTNHFKKEEATENIIKSHKNFNNKWKHLGIIRR